MDTRTCDLILSWVYGLNEISWCWKTKTWIRFDLKAQINDGQRGRAGPRLQQVRRRGLTGFSGEPPGRRARCLWCRKTKSETWEPRWIQVRARFRFRVWESRSEALITPWLFQTSEIPLSSRHVAAGWKLTVTIQGTHEMQTSHHRTVRQKVCRQRKKKINV